MRRESRRGRAPRRPKQERRRPIVVIESDRWQMALYTWDLEDDGYPVLSCDAAQSAVAECGRTPALVLLDIGAEPELAMQMIGQVRRAFPSAPLIVHSASNRCGREADLTAADAFLMKSSDLRALKRTVQVLTGGRHAGILNRRAPLPNSRLP